MMFAGLMSRWTTPPVRHSRGCRKHLHGKFMSMGSGDAAIAAARAQIFPFHQLMIMIRLIFDIEGIMQGRAMLG